MSKDLGASASQTGLSQAEPEVSIPSAARRVRQDYRVADEHDDYTFSPGAGMLRLARHETRLGEWWTGDFVDYRGLVSIQMERSYLRLDVVAGGQCHVRTWRRAFEDRTIAKLCRAFLTDLFGSPASGIGAGTADAQTVQP